MLFEYLKAIFSPSSQTGSLVYSSLGFSSLTFLGGGSNEESVELWQSQLQFPVILKVLFMDQLIIINAEVDRLINIKMISLLLFLLKRSNRI
jgi:hypothetical protein